MHIITGTIGKTIAGVAPARLPWDTNGYKTGGALRDDTTWEQAATERARHLRLRQTGHCTN